MTEKGKNNILKQAFVTCTQGYLDVSYKRDLWRNIATETNGFFSIRHNSGYELEMLKIELIYNNIKIEITESDTRPLKFEINFQSSIDYNLIIGWEDSIEKILKKLGKREIELGYPDFDEHYLVQSKDYNTTIKFLTQNITRDILKQNMYSLSYSTENGTNKSKLMTVISRVVNDKKTFEDLIVLHKKIIDRLEKLKIINNN